MFLLAEYRTKVTVPASGSIAVPIPVTRMGFVHKVAVKATTSTTVTVNLYNQAETTGVPKEITTIIPQQTDSGGSIQFIASNCGYPFAVKGQSTTNAKFYIYLELQAASGTVCDIAVLWRSND